MRQSDRLKIGALFQIRLNNHPTVTVTEVYKHKHGTVTGDQINTLGLGLEPNQDKKEACPARVAGAGQENIKTVHGPKPIQAADTL